MKVNPTPDFKLLFETVPGMYLVLSPEFAILAASNSYIAASMTKREDILGRNIFDVFPDNPADERADGVKNLQTSLNYVLEKRQPHRMAIQHYDVRRPDGIFEEHWWSPLNTPVIDGTGELCCILHYVEDVTEDQKKQKELDFLALQIEKAQDAIYTVDTNLKINNWNYGAENLYGYTKEEALGKDPNALLLTDVEGLYLEQVKKEVDANDYQTGEFKRKHKNGREIWVRFSASTIRNNDIITGYVVVNFDISKQKLLSEQVNHLAQIVEQSSEAIFSRGLDMRIISWNHGAEELFGYSKQEAIGKNAKELGFLNLTADEIAHKEAEMLRYDSVSSELLFNHKNGSSFYGAVTGNVSRNEKGQITSFYFIVKDISHRIKLEEHLKRANLKLEDEVKQRTAAILESEKKYRYLFENNPLPMWIIDRENFRFLDVNETAIEHYGYSREEFLSMTALDIRSETDRDAFLKIDRASHNASAMNDVGNWNHIKKDGSVIKVRINSHRIHFDNRPAILVLVNDETEKIKAEEKLLASEKRFRTLIEKAHDVITLMDSSFNLVYRSPAAERATGWSNEEVLNMDALKNVHPDDIKQIKAILEMIISNPGVTYKIRLRNLHKNGHYIWMEGILTNRLDDENVKAIVFNYQDVTDRIEADAKIRASEEKFRTLVEKADDVITMMDASFKLIYRSPAAERVTGWSNEDMLHVNATRNIHPDDQAAAQTIVQQVMANPGVTFNTRFRNLHKNGHYIWMEGAVTNWLNDENVGAIVFNYKDVTERVEAAAKIEASEVRFRTTLDNMIEGVQIVDFNWKYTYVNKAFTKHARYSKEELIGHTVMEKFPEIENTEIYNVYLRCFNERVAIQLENEFEFPDKTIGWFELSFQPVPEGVFILSVDITDRKRSEAALEAERNKLDKITASAPGLIYSFRASEEGEYSFTYASNAFEEMIGFTFDEVKNDVAKIFSNINPEQVADVVQSIRRSQQELIPWSYEYRYLHPQKGMVWHFGNSIPVREPDGSTVWHGVISDITGIKKAEEKLKESNERFQYATTATSDIVWELNFETKEYIVYEGREKLFDPVGEIGWQVGVEGKYLVEKDRERVRMSFKNARNDKNQEFWSDEYDVYAVDGTIIRMINHAVFIRDTNGKVTRVIGAMQDVTQQRKLEAELQEQQHKEQLMITATALDAQEKERNAIGMELHDNVNQLLVGTYMLLRMVGNHPERSEELINTSIGHVKAAIDENRKLAHELVSPKLNDETLPDLLNGLTNSMLINAGIKVEIDCSEYKDSMINDKIKLAAYRVVQEQCSNIIKYASAQHTFFYLSTKRNTFTLQIKDDGKGKDLKHDVVTEGIGLKNIAARVSVFGGKIQIHASPGGGFGLNIKIPLQKHG